MGTRQEPCECYFDRWERLCEAEFLLVVILFGEGSSQAQDSLFLDVIPLQQHHSHDEKHRHSRRVLTISWVFSFSERASWCSVVHSDVNWPCSQHVCMRPFPVVSFFLTFLWSSDSVDVWTLHWVSHRKKKRCQTNCKSFQAGLCFTDDEKTNQPQRRHLHAVDSWSLETSWQ